MSESFVSHMPLPKSQLLEKMKSKRVLASFELEVTARCNFNCRHCYINVPAGHRAAKEKELSLGEIKEIADEAVALGALWCLITGGEPLLREDFLDIYLYLRKKGLLLSVFTNGSLVTAEHVKLFQKYPPRNLEVSVYGTNRVTYQKITRRPRSYGAFRRGLGLLLESGVSVGLKSMALRSNINEQEEIARFCRVRTKEHFRIDPSLHLRYDGNPERNIEIKSERLSPAEIVTLERANPERRQAIERNCAKLHSQKCYFPSCNNLFQCGAGYGSCTISSDGVFRLCSSLWHPNCTYDLKTGNVSDAWHNFVPRVRAMGSDREGFLVSCRLCQLRNLCMWCPANAHLETGELDAPVEYFCEVARTRAKVFAKVRPVQ